VPQCAPCSTTSVCGVETEAGLWCEQVRIVRSPGASQGLHALEEVAPPQPQEPSRFELVAADQPIRWADPGVWAARSPGVMQPLGPWHMHWATLANVTQAARGQEGVCRVGCPRLTSGEQCTAAPTARPPRGAASVPTQSQTRRLSELTHPHVWPLCCRAGEQVCISYGQLPNEGLFLL
jgi:hypothetical protein